MSKTMDQRAFEIFAELHPLEAYAKWPGRFWRYFKRRSPGVTRQEMERLLMLAEQMRTEDHP
jgi:hypothetical protein